MPEYVKYRNNAQHDTRFDVPVPHIERQRYPGAEIDIQCKYYPRYYRNQRGNEQDDIPYLTMESLLNDFFNRKYPGSAIENNKPDEDGDDII